MKHSKNDTTRKKGFTKHQLINLIDWFLKQGIIHKNIYITKNGENWVLSDWVVLHIKRDMEKIN